MERQEADSAYLNGGYVFCDELGQPYCEQLSDFFDQAQTSFDAKRLTFHGLRHTSATMLLAAHKEPNGEVIPGLSVHIVSQRLGHADVSITMNTYAHVLKEQETLAAERIGQFLYAGRAHKAAHGLSLPNHGPINGQGRCI